MRKNIAIWSLVPAILLVFAAGNLHAGAARTTYPVVFAHGMAGFDDLLGYDYWGDDYGTFVGNPCDKFLEVSCNSYIDAGQKAFAAQVQPFQTSEVRGYDLANDTEGYMATVGAPTAKYILDLKPDVTNVINALATIFGSGNDGIAAAKQLVYNDYDANDGKTTGAKDFNVKYPVSSTYASRYGSLMTAQNGLSVNPALFLLVYGLYDIDGDGYCVDDCDNDGAAGKGDGSRTDRDDDGLVGINSQQMGYRLYYTVYGLGLFDYIGTESSNGYVSNLNAPTSTQMRSSTAVIEQDHLNVVGVPPDTFDEIEFHAAIIDYIAYYN